MARGAMRLVSVLLFAIAAVDSQVAPSALPSALPRAWPTPLPSSLPSALPSPLPSPLPSALPRNGCKRGLAGRGDGSLACDACPGGRVPSAGTCFAGMNKSLTASYGGSCYYVASAAKWTHAEQECTRAGGHLACVNDETEATFLVDWVRGTALTTTFWIGLNDRGNEWAYDWSNPRCCSNYRRWEVQRLTNSDGTTSVLREPAGSDAATDGGTIRTRCVHMSTEAGINKLYDSA